MINLNIQDFELFKDKNLKIRHLISDLMPFLDESTLKRYKDFFNYSERIEKRVKYIK